MQINSIRWDITNRCNLSCLHCYAKSVKENDLKYSQILKIIEKLIPLGLKEINFSGREPTLRNDLSEIIKWCCKRTLRVNITTNGTVLNADGFKKLLSTDVNMLVFSLDGASAIVHDKIRGNGSFNKTIENIKICVEYINKNRINSKIGISFTLQKINATECENIITLCDSLDVDFLGINPISFCGSASMRKSSLYLKPEEILSCWEKICKEYKRNVPEYELYLGTFPQEAKFLNVKYDIELPIIYTGCSAGRTLYINPAGKALPCYMLPPIAEEISELRKYLKFWDILVEPPEIAISTFRPFIQFTAEYSQKNNSNCKDCGDLEVCKRCPLIAVFDTDAIYRCQIAGRRLNEIAMDINENTTPSIKKHIKWIFNDNILSITINKNGYLCNKKLELAPLAKEIWTEISKQNSLLKIESNLRKKCAGMTKTDLRKNIIEFLEYFWKEDIIQLS